MPDAPSPLTLEQQQELQSARERAGTFLRASHVASVNGWTIGFFAAASILFGLFSLSGLLVGLGLAVVARNEFVGRRRLLALELGSLELLWRNQVGLMALVVAYCVWSMVRAVAQPDPELIELTELLGTGTTDLVRSLSLTMYSLVIAVTIVVQGLNARYYFVRVARLQEYLRETPGWVLDLQRAATLS